jgi:hypothetical protein
MTEYTDAELLEVLSRVFARLDPPPDHVLAHAKSALTWQTLDAELAELVYDSRAQDAALVRGDTREVTFRAPGIEVEIMVLSERHRSLVGQVVPAQAANIELRHGDATATTTADTLGRFTFEQVASGPIKLIVVTESGARVQTEGLVI